MSELTQAIGIDLGTTNSVAAYYDGNEARIITTTTPDGIIPSVVVYRNPRKVGEEGQLLVGEAASDYAKMEPTNAVWSIKRLMGRSFDDPKVQDVKDRVNYKIVKSEDSDDPGVRVELGGRQYSPMDISAMILGEAKRYAESAFGNEVTHAVITVPAYFEESQRAATREAGEKAGLIVKKIIDEPTAAAIAFGVTVIPGQRQRILVFDLGGGTFDVSIIMTTSGPDGKPHFEVLDMGGDNWLGGDDFDAVIMRKINSFVVSDHNHDPAEDPAFQFLAKKYAEKAKKQLTTQDEAEIADPGAGQKSDGSFFDLQLTVTRKEFESEIEDRVDDCINEISKLLNKLGFTNEDIDTVLLVGGSTLIPLVRHKVTNFFGKSKVQQILNPYHAVAQGAGILAATLKGVACPRCDEINDERAGNCKNCNESLATAASAGDVSIGEVTAMAFGVDAVRGDKADQFEIIIPKSTPYPLKESKTRRFTTTQDNLICIHVYEGGESKASANREQGVIEVSKDEFETAGIDVPRGTEVEVGLNFDKNRVLQVTIRVPKYNFFREKELSRDRPRQSQDETNGKWREDLEHLMVVAMDFKSSYSMYMEPHEQLKLDQQIDRAQEALMSGNAVAGKSASRRVAHAIDACGVASLLFLADRVARDSTSPDHARTLSDYTAKLKAAWHSQQKEIVAQLTKPLRTVIAAELTSRRETEGVHTEDVFGGALRVD